MKFNNNYFKISKTIAYFFIIYMSTLSSFSYYLYLMTVKLDALEAQGALLIKENETLKKNLLIISQKVVEKQELKPDIHTMSDEYKIFLIKVSLIILAIILCGSFVTYIYIYAKSYILNNWIFKSILSLNELTLNSIYAYFDLLKPTEYTYIDKFSNTIKVLISNSSERIDVLIKPTGATDFLNLSDFLGNNPQLFSQYSQLSIDILSDVAANPIVNQALETFNRLN